MKRIVDGASLSSLPLSSVQKHNLSTLSELCYQSKNVGLKPESWSVIYYDNFQVMILLLKKRPKGIVVVTSVESLCCQQHQDAYIRLLFSQTPLSIEYLSFLCRKCIYLCFDIWRPKSCQLEKTKSSHELLISDFTILRHIIIFKTCESQLGNL